MKKLFFTLSVFLLCCTLAACATNKTADTNTPQSVAVRAVEVMHKGDADTLFSLLKMPEKLKEKEGAEDMFRGKIKMLVSAVHKRAQKKGGVASVTAGETTYSDDKKQAKVQVTVKFKNGEEITKPTRVVLFGKRWLIGRK